MTAPVSTIRNLGPATEAQFARAGLNSAEMVRELGTDEAYRRLLAAGERPHFIGFYALEMGLQGRLWNDCSAPEKKVLRKRFDAIVAESFDPARLAFETAMNEIGVGSRR